MSRKNLLNLINVPADATKGAAAGHKLVQQVTGTLREERARQVHANSIERRLAEGQAVIDLDPADIDPSFAQDRMPGDIDGLLASIRDQGQQVPILVRPHPDQSGRYQVAFGHRRLRAVAELGLQVKTIVRDLTDEQLVVAQGQENSERKDLSYIERARFADRLNRRFAREIITAAMSISKPELSVMLSVLAAIPADLVEAIGSAPGVGRRSWQELAASVEKAHALADAAQYAQSPEVQSLTSEERFKAVINHLKPPRPVRGAPGVLSTSTGERLGQLKQSKTKLEIMIDRKAAPDFATFVVEQLPALYEAHRARQKHIQGE